VTEETTWPTRGREIHRDCKINGVTPETEETSRGFICQAASF